jgi:hypothetical protein
LSAISGRVLYLIKVRFIIASVAGFAMQNHRVSTDRRLALAEGFGRKEIIRGSAGGANGLISMKDTDLILMSLRSKRLEGWTQRRDSRPSFETRKGAPQDEGTIRFLYRPIGKAALDRRAE